MNAQFSIGSHRIDLYFPEHKIAVECNEYDHIDRDIYYEINRQKFIEDQLNCEYIRYNSDAENVRIERVLSKIIRFM